MFIFHRFRCFWFFFKNSLSKRGSSRVIENIFIKFLSICVLVSSFNLSNVNNHQSFYWLYSKSFHLSKVKFAFEFAPIFNRLFCILCILFLLHCILYIKNIFFSDSFLIHIFSSTNKKFINFSLKLLVYAQAYYLKVCSLKLI